MTWSDLWSRGVWENLIADFYFAALTVGGFFLWVAYLRRQNRQRVARFLGLPRRQVSVPTHVSVLTHQTAEGPKPDAVKVPFIHQYEVEAFGVLRRLVEGPIREGPANVVAAARRQTSLRRIEVQLRTDPPAGLRATDSGGLTILLGTGRFNARAAAVLGSSASFFRYAKDDHDESRGEWTFFVNQKRTGVHRDYLRINGRHPDAALSTELAVIQRLHDPETRATVLLCSGLSAAASQAAAEYLVANWRRLEERHRGAAYRDFGLVLKMPDQDRHGPWNRDGVLQEFLSVHGDPIPGSHVHPVQPTPPPTPPSGTGLST